MPEEDCWLRIAPKPPRLASVVKMTSLLKSIGWSAGLEDSFCFKERKAAAAASGNGPERHSESLRVRAVIGFAIIEIGRAHV
jgi:hypothetical protein